MKNKTVAAWLAFLGGPIGLHRFYLHGMRDWLGWLLPVPTLLGIYGVLRMWNLGQDDVASWILVPVLGFFFLKDGDALRQWVVYVLPQGPWRRGAGLMPSRRATPAAVACADSSAAPSPGHRNRSWRTNGGCGSACCRGRTRRSPRRHSGGNR